MAERKSRSESVKSCRRRVAEIASQMLNRELGVFEGSQQLIGLWSQVEVSEDDPDFFFFEVVNSAAEHLPAAEAVARAEEFASMDEFIDVCRRLVQRFEAA